MKQVGNSCTGHAVAAMVNAILASESDPTHVSPYMLYALARRYDEFEGEADVGSSLRGALKGWYYHGVLPDTEWPRLDLEPEPDLDLEPKLCRLALERPLGRLLPRQRHPAGRHAVRHQRALRHRRLGRASTTAGQARAWSRGPSGARRRRMHVISRTDAVEGARRPRVLHRRLQRRRLPGAELLGDQWGRRRLRHPALRRLAGVGLRRVGRPARRPVGRVPATSARKVCAPGRAAWPRRGARPGPAAARRARRQPRQQRPALHRTGSSSAPRRQIDRIFDHMAETHERWDASTHRAGSCCTRTAGSTASRPGSTSRSGS